VNCQRIDEAEPFDCAGNLHTMLIPRDATSCFEAVLEAIEPGIVTPPNAHENFAMFSSNIFTSAFGRALFRNRMVANGVSP